MLDSFGFSELILTGCGWYRWWRVNPLPFPEVISNNVILALPKLVEGRLVTSEFSDRGGDPDSVFEEYVPEVLAILSLQEVDQRDSTDGQKMLVEYAVTFEGKRRYFLWNFQTDGRLPPRGAWHWEHDCGHFFRVILRVEIVAEGPKAGLLDTISVVQIEWLGWALNGLQEYAYAHLEGLLERVKRPEPVKPGDDTAISQLPR